MRTGPGRRFADIYDGLIGDFGADADPRRVREIAGLRFTLEDAQAEGACGLEHLVRLHRLIEQKERTLRASMKVQPKTDQSTVQERLAKNYPATVRPAQ